MLLMGWGQLQGLNLSPKDMLIDFTFSLIMKFQRDLNSRVPPCFMMVTLLAVT